MLFSKLLEERTQEEYAKHKKSVLKSPNEGYIEDTPFYYSLFKFLKDNAEHPKFKNGINEIVSFIRESLENNDLLTLSRVRYEAEGLDSVIHEFGMQDQYCIDENIVGPDEWIERSRTIDRYKAILGSKDVHKINSVFNFITEKNLYGWFLNDKLNEDIEKAVWIGSFSGRADLGCDGNPDGSDAGLAVRQSFRRRGPSRFCSHTGS